MDIKEQVKNNIMLKMRYHLDSQELDLLGVVLTDELTKVEVDVPKTELATVDNTMSILWISLCSKRRQSCQARLSGSIRMRYGGLQITVKSRLPGSPVWMWRVGLIALKAATAIHP